MRELTKLPALKDAPQVTFLLTTFYFSANHEKYM